MVSIASPDIVREFDKQYKILSKLDKYDIKSNRDDIVEIDGLMYQNDILTLDYTFDEAVDYSKRLMLGGYSDWRLPTVEELLILATDIKIEASYRTAYIRTEFAENILGKYSPNFWTSDEKEEFIEVSSFWGLKKEIIFSSTARVINYTSKKSEFNNYLQDLYYDDKNRKNYIICVRDKKSKEIY